jgi:hypothetical protein
VSVFAQRWLFIASLLLLTGGWALRAAQLTTNEVAESRIAATNSLNFFRKIVTPANYALLGLSSTGDVAHAGLGEPLRIWKIPAGSLTNYVANQSFGSLLVPAPQILYPILVKQEAVSSLWLRLENGKWERDGWGDAGLIRELTRMRKKFGGRAKQPPNGITPGVFAVKFPFSFWVAGFFDKKGDAVLVSSVNPSNTVPHLSNDHELSSGEMEILAKKQAAYTGPPKTD